MESIKVNNYSYLKSILPEYALDDHLVTYRIALEAWRRGIDLKFYTAFPKNRLKVRYNLSNEGNEYNFQTSLGDKVLKEARKIGKSKELTKNYLSDSGVQVPKGKVFNIEEGFKEVFSYSNDIGYPLVIKPNDGHMGKGVITNIRNDSELEAGLKYSQKNGYAEVIVEQYIEGDDTRLYVIENEVIAAYKRIPINVIGDGKHTILELINIKNELRKYNPHSGKYQINIDDKIKSFLKRQSYTLEDVPERNNRIFLSDSTLHIDGCEAVDITNELTEETKSVAIKSVKALPGMNLCGVDLIVDHNREESFVLELNSRPNIGGHLFPMEGKPRNVHKAIIDYYFPETINQTKEENNYYTFDFDDIYTSLLNGSFEEIKVPAIPKGKLVAKEYTVTGNIMHLKKLIHKNTVGLKLAGKLVEINTNEMKIVIAGKQKKMDVFESWLFEKQGKNTQVDILSSNKWKGLYVNRFQSPFNSRKHLALTEQIEEANAKIKKMENSKSWKITEPLRKLGTLIK